MAKSLDIGKALAKGFTREEIERFAQTRGVELKGEFPLKGSEFLSEAVRLPQQGVGIIADEAREALPDALDIDKNPSTSTAINVAKGLPKTLIDIGQDVGEDFTSPTSLALMAAGGPVAKVAGKTAKVTAQGAGKLLSGKSTKNIGRLFDDPGALAAGAAEDLFKPAQKAFKAAKEASGIRSIAQGKGAVQTASEAFSGLQKVRDDVARQATALIKAGVPKRQALTAAFKSSRLGQATLEARQKIASLSKKVQNSPDVAALRNRLNAVLDRTAQAVREADPLVSRAKLGQDFIQFAPEGLVRRLASFGGLAAAPATGGTSALSAALTSPVTTGVATATAGAGNLALQAASKTPLRRAIMGALLNRREERDAQRK